MQDLTQGPVSGHILRLAAPITVGMLFQTLYYLVDLYFVARLGDAAIAGVSAAGTAQVIGMALTQILGVGTMALIAHAVGRKDRNEANLVFNQSLLLALVCTLFGLVGGYALIGPYLRTLGADAATTAAGIEYLRWFLPSLALQFVIVVMSSALRGTGIAKPTMVAQVVTLALNVILAPVLIAGWGTGHPLGVAGAGLASSISVAVGLILLALYFLRLEKYVAFDTSLLRVRLPVWSRLLKIGLPPGGEFALMFVYASTIYWLIRDFGPEAQAGFGMGSRVMQAFFMPALAISFATGPVAGQNVGAGKPERVRATFRAAALLNCIVMLALMLLCQWRPDAVVHLFTQEAAVVEVATQFLTILSWNFVATGLVFTCSAMFQALGNTLPALVSSATRLVTFVVPAMWLAQHGDFSLRDLWLLSVATVTFQLAVSLLWLRREMRLKLTALTPRAEVAAAPTRAV